MTRWNKRILSIALCLLMLFSIAPALSNVNSASWNYTISGKTLKITGTGAMTDYANYTGAPWYGKDIDKIEVDSGITRIGNNAFAVCKNVTSVSLPDTLKSIGNNAFYNCQSLPSINLGSAVETIGEYAFYYCYALKTIDLGKSLKTIGKYAFAQCTVLDNVVLPNTTTTIGDYAFAYNYGLNSIYIPASVTSIGPNAFSNDSKVIISCEPGSYAEQYAKDKGIDTNGDSSDEYTVKVVAKKTSGTEVTVKNATVSVYDNSNGNHVWLFDKKTDSNGLAKISTDGLTENQIKNLTVSAYIVDNQGSNIDGTARNELFKKFGTTSSGDPIRFIYELHSETIDANGNWNGEKLPDKQSDTLKLTLSEPRLKVNLAVSYLEDPNTSNYEQKIKDTMSYASEWVAQATDGHVMFNKILLVPTNDRLNFADPSNEASMADIQIQANISEGNTTNGITIGSNASGYGFYTSDQVNFSTSNFKHLQDTNAFANGRGFWRVQLSGYNANWSTQMGESKSGKTVAHELGHYLFGFFDEYMDAESTKISTITNTSSTNSLYAPGFGLMDVEYFDIELSRDIRDYAYLNGQQHHSTTRTNETYQSWANEKSCEQQLADLLSTSHTFVNDTDHNPHPWRAREGTYSFRSGNYQATYRLAPSATDDRHVEYSYASLKNSAFSKSPSKNKTSSVSKAPAQNTASSQYSTYISDSQKILAYIYDAAGSSANFTADMNDYSFNGYHSINEGVRISTVKSNLSGELYGEISNKIGIDFSSISWFKYENGVWTKINTDVTQDFEELYYKVRCDYAGDGLYVIMAKDANLNSLQKVNVVSYTNSDKVDALSEITINDPNNSDDIAFYNVYISERNFSSVDNVYYETFVAGASNYKIQFENRNTNYYVRVVAIGKDGSTSPLGPSFVVKTGEADRDHDGIPDWYCDKYHLWGEDDTKDIANSDENGNGLTNLEEYLAGNDPTKYEEGVTYYNVDVKAENGGKVSGGGNYANGVKVNLTATPNSGYHFIGWYKGDSKVSDQLKYSFTVSEDVTLTAKFEEDEPPTDPNACPQCGKVHEGFFGKIVGFFHRIIYRLTHLFKK